MKFAHSLLAGAALAVSMTTAAHAADLLTTPVDPIYSSPLFNFEGLYVGAQGGGAISGGIPYGVLGLVVGSNFAVTDGIVAGIEFQGDAYYNGGFTAFDALALGRVGGFVSDNAMVYGELGAGFTNATPVYAFGGGVEMAVAETTQLCAANCRDSAASAPAVGRQGNSWPALAPQLSRPSSQTLHGPRVSGAFAFDMSGCCGEVTRRQGVAIVTGIGLWNGDFVLASKSRICALWR